MSDVVRTQLSGKLSKKDRGLFQLRESLIGAGIDVQFPFAEIVGAYKGIPVTFVPSRERSFYHVELEFFMAIRTNPVHIVHNKHGKSLGYVGRSASMEIAYAILHNKPIIFLYKLRFSAGVPPSVRKLIEANTDRFFVRRIDRLSGRTLVAYITAVIKDFKNQYDLCDVATEIGVMESTADLFDSYKEK